MTATETEARFVAANLAELLLELAIGLHRYGMYPTSHPSVIALGDRLARRVNAYTEREGAVSVGVADGRLVVGTATTDPSQPILRDFAKKMRDKGVGGFVLLPDLAAVDLELFLQALSEDGEDGLLPELGTDRIRLLSPGYDRLELSDPELAGADPAVRVNDLWLGLARSAISNGAIESGDAADVPGIAESVKLRLREPGGGRLMLGYMAQIAGALAEGSEHGPGESMATVRDQFAALIEALDPETLRELLERGGGNEANVKLAFDVCRTLDPTTAIKVLEAIPKQEGRRISHQLARLLRKMSMRGTQVPSSRRQHAVEAFRDAVERLARGWRGSGACAAFHGAGDLQVLGEMADEDGLSMELRVLWISLETGAVGASLEAAVQTLIGGGRIPELLSLVRGGPKGHPVLEVVRDQLHSDHTISHVVRSEGADGETLDALLEGAGLSAIPPLLDALIESPSRAVRRVVFDRLSKLGMPAGLAAVTRLESQPWYVLRNLLVLAQSLDQVPAGVELLPLMSHEDVRVRREAFPVCLKVPDVRAPAIKAALGDQDGRLVDHALREVRSDLPGFLVPDVARHLDDPERNMHAIDALADSDSRLALKELLDVCRGRGLLRGARLGKKSPALLRALAALKDKWSGVDEVSQLLAQAADSRDPEIRAAVGGTP